jgi:outer membrane protein W
MDAGQLGPLGVSLFVGGRAYAIVDDRTISFGTTQSYDDQLGTDDATALFEVKVDPWMFRTHVGIRFHYLGNQD